MTRRRQTSRAGKFTQYILVGASLGLYNGVFYHSSGNADVEIAIELALLAAVVTVAVRSWKKGLRFQQILKDFLTTFASFLIFMLSLALRKFALDAGGWGLMVAECMLAGALMGLLLAWQRQLRVKRNT